MTPNNSQLTTIQEMQKEILENKKRKGFNTTNIPEEFCYLYGEVSEAFDAYKKEGVNDHFAEELADVAIFTLGIAEITGIDLEKEIIKKMKKNSDRTTHKTSSGFIVHD